MKNKFKNIVEGIFGKQVKNRWKKILKFIIAVILTVTLATILIIIAVNTGYDRTKGGLYFKPWDIKLNIKKEFK